MDSTAEAPLWSVAGIRLGVLAGIVLAGLSARPAAASFHLMQIEQVIGGVNGDTSAQAIQLRMRGAGQNLLDPSRIRVFDATGANPVVIYDFESVPANFTVGSGLGRRILLVTPSFPMHTTPMAVDDVSLMVAQIPASYLAAGSMTFETDNGVSVYWRLSWGGAGYTGPCNGVGPGGNDADGNFCPAFPGPLPSNGAQAVLFDGAAGDPSTNNSADYIVTAGSAVFINNAAAPGMFTVNPCGVDGDCNDSVACTSNMCNTGPNPNVCVFTPDNGLCPSDGMFCNGPEVCNAIAGCVSSGNPCMPPTPFCDEGTMTCGACNMDGQCDDGIACSMDSCVGGNCNHAPDHASCNNGQFCDGVEICNIMVGGCQSPGTPCDAGEACDEMDDMCEPAPFRIKLVPVTGPGRAGPPGLFSPVQLTHANDGSERLFIVDQAGYIRVVDGDALLATPFLDLTGVITALNPAFDERGLLGLAFHPDYMNNGRFFVRYSKSRVGSPAEPCFGSSFGCHSEVLAEYQVSIGDPNVADAGSEVILLSADKPQFNHNAGHLAFGTGGYLYVTLGDGGGAHDGLADGPPSHGPIGNGQNRFAVLGKVLRLDVGSGAVLPDDFPGDPNRNYAIPPANPFADGVNGAPEVYAYGFRNPYRFSFDRADGTLYVADVGQNLFEEVDIVTLGGNYGWAAKEGDHFFDPQNPGTPPGSCLPMWASAGIDCMSMIDPISEYTHAEGGQAIIGGFVYRGTAFAALDGHYVYGDFSSGGPTGRLYYFETTGPNAYERVEFVIGAEGDPLGKYLKGFGEDEDGEIYVMASDDGGPARGMTGVVYRLEECVVRPFGDIAPLGGDGVVDLDDILCVLDDFAAPGNCAGDGDVVPCDVGGGLIDLDDILAILDAFAGDYACGPACG